MSATYAHGGTAAARPGTCGWVHLFEDVRLACRDRAIPGGQLCADHLIDWAHLPAQWHLDGEVS